MNTSKIVFFCILILLPTYVFAQETTFVKTNSIQKTGFYQTSKKGKSKNFTSGLMPIYTIGGTPYSNPELNFTPSTQLFAAGDVNNDGFEDFYYSVTAADETTEELADEVRKVVLFYGSSEGLTEENSTISKQNFSFIGDLNNDGISDGYRIENDTLYLHWFNEPNNFEKGFSKKMMPIERVLTINNFGDINNDGFNDLLVYSNRVENSDSLVFQIIFGAENLKESNYINIDSFVFPDSDRRGVQILISDTNNDGIKEIIILSYLLQSSTGGLISINHLDDNNELQELQSNPIENLFYADFFSSSDLNNDGFQELIIGHRYLSGRIYIFGKSEKENELYNFEDYESFSEFSDFSDLGDFDGDGSNDLLIYKPKVNVVNGEDRPVKASLLFGFDSMLNFESTPFETEDTDFSLITNNQGRVNASGDVNKDGFDDITIEFETENGFGFRTYYGNSNAEFSNYSEISYSFPEEYVNYTFNAGDVNGDGIDDFGLVYERDPKNGNPSPRVEVFFGGDLSKTIPDVVISHPQKYDISAPASGDFNGDGYSDLLLNYENKISGLNIYFGGPVMDSVPDYELTFKAMFPEIERFGTGEDAAFEAPVNAGDINNDGIDDFIFSAYLESTNTYILFGGNEISEIPDIIIPFYASNFTSLEDMNGDGINDIALSLFSNGSARVYAGFDQSLDQSFNTEPIATFKFPVSEEDVYTFLLTMEAGDFNGDGFSDLATGSFQHYKSSNPSLGADAIYLYFGGNELPEYPDKAFPLKTEYFRSYGDVFQTDLYLTRHIGELTAIPDLNDDGTEELMVGTTPIATDQTNAFIFMGNIDGSLIGEDTGILLKAPNQNLGLGSSNNNIIAQTAHSAVGDFDNDGNIDLVLTQGNDLNFFKSPVYVYELKDIMISNDALTENARNFTLSQNYPNPFNPTTKINYSLVNSGNVSLKVYDITGRLIATLVEGVQASGIHSVPFNASNLSSGIYFYRLESGDGVLTKKMMLIK